MTTTYNLATAEVISIVMLVNLVIILAGDWYNEIQRRDLWPLTSQLLPATNLDPNEFRVAVITAGEVRSFAFVEKSWIRYIFKPNREGNKGVYLFAHVIDMPDCPLAKMGIHRLQKLATEIEISSSAPIYSPIAMLTKLPEHFRSTDRWRHILTNSNWTRGNFVDMYARRERAYNMANHYAAKRGFEWDLFLFCRLDLAFYEPAINFYQIYQTLGEYNKMLEARAIFIPSECNFHGVCDRFAIGIPKEMEVYFQHEFAFRVLEWSQLSDNVTENVQRNHLAPYAANETLDHPKMFMGLTGSSEHALELWFVMNNLTQLDLKAVSPGDISQVASFATARIEHALAYCSRSRLNYSHHYPDKNNFIWDPDKTAIYPRSDESFSRFDIVSSSLERCGKHIQQINSVPKLCGKNNECKCSSQQVYDELPVPI